MKFRVYKYKGTKCIRKFDSLEEAQGWCYIRECDYRVEWVEPADDEHGIPERKNVWFN